VRLALEAWLLLAKLSGRQRAKLRRLRQGLAKRSPLRRVCK
jgi:hypothetical protein